ncbi:MAG: hypothetical protein OZ935_00610 [Pseudomonadota bacterium]|nr:hypothetical protein [Pseudomonadota bacterium]
MNPHPAPARTGITLVRTALAIAVLCAPTLVVAQTASAKVNPSPIDFGLVLDGAYVSEDLALAQRERGFGLGHSELTVGGRVDDLFAGRLTAALHHHDGETEVELEEAFIDALALPAGLQLRAGRFLSQVGYLNERHTHADDFTERPLLYRAFLGGHWSDTGVRLNWVAPTALYWRIGVEAFDGGRLAGESSSARTVGVTTLSTRLGGDLGASHSWQLGLSFLRNRIVPSPEGDGSHDHDEEEEGHDHDHAHAHGAAYTGKRMFIADAVWKWAPGGNNAGRQLRLSGEYARVTDLNEFATGSDIHEAWYLAAVYRFAPQWEVGVRTGALDVSEPHGDHFHSGRLRETSLMLAWVRSHFSTLRLQWTTQKDRGGFAQADNALSLQYVMSLGAHGAHAF